MQNHSRALIAVCLACIAPLLFGYSLGFTSPSLLFMEISATGAIFPATVTATGGVVSAEGARFGALVNVGAMVGALAGGPLSDRLGRRPAIGTCAVLWMMAWMLLSMATTPMAAHVPRALTGVAVGIASATVPVYIAEVAPVAIRGALGALNQLGVVLGILLVYALGYFFQVDTQSSVACTAGLADPLAAATLDESCARIAVSGWRCENAHCYGAMTAHVPLAYAASATSLVLLAAVIALLPETPGFLLQRGYSREAAKVQAWLGGEASCEPQDVMGHAEGDGVALTSPVAVTPPEEDGSANGGDSSPAPRARSAGAAGLRGSTGWGACWGALLATGVRAPLGLACGLMLVQQLSGINAVIFYSSDILLRGGVADANLGGVFIMSIQVVMTGCAVLLVDRAGRRPLLLGSIAGMFVSCVALAYFFAHVQTAPTWLALASLVGYVCSFSAGLGALPWLIMGEIFPARVRATASSVATMLNWTCSFVITLVFSSAAAAIGPAKVFLIFALVCACGFAFVFVLLPETRGVPLEQIEALFATNGGRASLSPASSAATDYM